MLINNFEAFDLTTYPRGDNQMEHFIQKVYPNVTLEYLLAFMMSFAPHARKIKTVSSMMYSGDEMFCGMQTYTNARVDTEEFSIWARTRYFENPNATYVLETYMQVLESSLELIMRPYIKDNDESNISCFTKSFDLEPNQRGQLISMWHSLR